MKKFIIFALIITCLFHAELSYCNNEKVCQCPEKLIMVEKHRTTRAGGFLGTGFVYRHELICQKCFKPVLAYGFGESNEKSWIDD